MARNLKSNPSKVLPEARAKELQRELDAKYPDLTVTVIGSAIHVRGSLPILYEEKILDRYQIDIEWSDADSEAPKLRETGGRIPWTPDRHMNQDGLACPFVPEEWLLRPREERTLTYYLDEPARNFFLWQSLFERGESPPWNDRSHGVPGLIEAYGDMVEMRGEKAIRECLFVLSKLTFKGHWICPCGSGQKIRRCHLQHLQNLRLKVSPHVARLALRRLENPLIR